MPSTKDALKVQPLSWIEKWSSIILGVLVLAAAHRLYFHPPERTNTTVAAFPLGAAQQTTVNRADAEPGSVVIVMLTAGIALLVYAVNGIKVTKFSGPFGEIEAGHTDTVIPDFPEGSTPPPATPLVAPGTPPEGQNQGAAHTLDVLLTPMIWPELGAANMPGPPFPLAPREAKTGEQITIDLQGFKNTTSVYFFSHDIMLCFSALLSGAPRKIVVHTARQAAIHLSRIGFAGTKLLSQLNEIVVECDTMPEDAWSEARRQELAAEIFRLSRNVGGIIEKVAPK